MKLRIVLREYFRGHPFYFVEEKKWLMPWLSRTCTAHETYEQALGEVQRTMKVKIIAQFKS